MGKDLSIDIPAIMQWAMKPDTDAFSPGEGRQIGDNYFYVVKSGDTLLGIASEKCKTVSLVKVREIAQENGIRNIHKILPKTPVVCKIAK
jgi:hypothetical protein